MAAWTERKREGEGGGLPERAPTARRLVLME